MDVLRRFLPEGLKSQVEVYRAPQSQPAKDLTAKRFAQGEICILIFTEVLTMGCDFKNIEQVVMFKVPGSPATALQRGGRSGRDESIQARVVMMIEASKRAQAIADLALELAAVERMKTKQEDEEVSFEPVDLDGKDVGGERKGNEDETAVEGIRARVTLDGVVDVLCHVYICIQLRPTPERQPSLTLLPYANQSRPHRVVLKLTCLKNKHDEITAPVSARLTE
ncbi:ATP-dependent DNA helicase sgs1 [Ceratobasidium sp. 395]|nr:ATP-dependent DNA helicase sgs1 [Ceratobasidium sp. 395]